MLTDDEMSPVAVTLGDYSDHEPLQGSPAECGHAKASFGGADDQWSRCGYVSCLRPHP